MLSVLHAALLAFSPGAGLTRRDLFSLVGAATAATPIAAHAVSARTGAASPFTGEYDDPKHPGCLRSVKVVGPKLGPDGRKGRNPIAYVKGVDNVAGSKACEGAPDIGSVWKLEGKVSEDGETVLVDFSPKTEGRVGTLLGRWEDDMGPAGIAWPDGNKWIKVANGTPERRPPNLTLNSD